MLQTPHLGSPPPPPEHPTNSLTLHPGMAFLKEITETVLRLHTQTGRNKLLAELMRDIAWTRESLPLEMMAAFRQSEYDAHDPDTYDLMYALKAGVLFEFVTSFICLLLGEIHGPGILTKGDFCSEMRSGTSSTKDVLESTFAHLTDVSKRHSKNQKMAFYSRWLYAICAPYSKDAAPQLFPNREAWLTYRTSDPELQKAS